MGLADLAAAADRLAPAEGDQSSADACVIEPAGGRPLAVMEFAGCFVEASVSGRRREASTGTTVCAVRCGRLAGFVAPAGRVLATSAKAGRLCGESSTIPPEAAFFCEFRAAIWTRDSASRSEIRALPGGVFEATCLVDFLLAALSLAVVPLVVATCSFDLAGGRLSETVVVLQPPINKPLAPRQAIPVSAIQPRFRRLFFDPIISVLPS